MLQFVNWRGMNILKNRSIGARRQCDSFSMVHQVDANNNLQLIKIASADFQVGQNWSYNTMALKIWTYGPIVSNSHPSFVLKLPSGSFGSRSQADFHRKQCTRFHKRVIPENRDPISISILYSSRMGTFSDIAKLTPKYFYYKPKWLKFVFDPKYVYRSQIQYTRRFFQPCE